MPSKTISFVAKDELVEWLEEESEKRMTSMSSTVQQLLAERYREEVRSRENGGSGETALDETGKDTDERKSDQRESKYDYEIIGNYEDKWYRPESEDSRYAVKVGERVHYYKTQGGLADRLETEFE